MRDFNFGLQSIWTLGLGVGLVMFGGCGQSNSSEQPVTTVLAASVDAHDDHATEGPHHGGLVELGNEEYHIEIVHDDVAGSVTAYLLDSSAKLAVADYATQILVNLSHDGQAEQFALTASPQSSDPPGKSSRFVSTDAELAEDLDNDAVAAQIVVEIGGKQYRGAIHHDHDAHDDHDEHEGEAHGHE